MKELNTPDFVPHGEMNEDRAFREASGVHYYPGADMDQTYALARGGLIYLFDGGWEPDAICKTPWFVLADWLRDRGHDIEADAISKEWDRPHSEKRIGYAHILFWAKNEELINLVDAYWSVAIAQAQASMRKSMAIREQEFHVPPVA
jgi:hypothetical protein